MLTIENLNFTYPQTATPAIRDMNFSVAQGEIFGFLGPSGAGKSTTQKILIGLLKGYQGRVAAFGRDLTGWKSDYYERVGVCFELPNHFLKLTALENLAYFGSLYRGPVQEAQKLLERLGLEKDARKPVSQFSKGMKGRLSLARSLLHDPELLFLDEPTSGQDPVNAQMIKELIRGEQRAGKTIFLTTHDMAVADALCDRVAFIAGGAIRIIDTPRALKLRFGMPSVSVEYQEHGNTARREFALAGLGNDNDFLALLRSGTVQTIHSQEAQLEDVFIQVTGQPLN